MKRCVDTLNLLVKGEANEDGHVQRQIFEEKMAFGMDNHFSGNATSQEVGERGWKCNQTCQHEDRFPKGVENKYFHALKEVKVDARS